MRRYVCAGTGRVQLDGALARSLHAWLLREEAAHVTRAGSCLRSLLRLRALLLRTRLLGVTRDTQGLEVVEIYQGKPRKKTGSTIHPRTSGSEFESNSKGHSKGIL